VYSRTLATVATARTRIEREFDPDVRRLEQSSASDLAIGGAEGPDRIDATALA
jgi:hypothetical protein